MTIITVAMASTMSATMVPPSSSMNPVSSTTISGVRNSTYTAPVMMPATRIATGTPGNTMLSASATLTEAKMSGNVGPPRNPLLNPTLSSASLATAITSSRATP